MNSEKNMNFQINITPEFLKSLKALSKRHRSIKTDFKNFTDSLRENPFQGDEIAPGIRKIRMAITSKGRGKSGGARVITFTIVASEQEGKIYLIEIYDKADYSTVDITLIKRITDKIVGGGQEVK